MIDTFSILLSHALLFVACWRLLSRPALNDERDVRNGAAAESGAPPDA
ncbi:MAG TPA: hypothetical protein VFX27_02680 [Sphingobium sp.]|nr:hypothetical protein [Sphingobium sp.]